MADELRRLGASRPQTRGAGVAFSGKLALAYRACIESRFASRVLVPVGSVEGGSRDALHRALRDLPWEHHVPADGSLAVDFAGTNPVVRHTRFGAQLTKDAIVDRLRDRTGQRPRVDLERPDVRINVHLGARGAIASVDLSGRGLHRRGYRPARAPAPLRETLAAAILALCDWPRIARDGGSFVDPMCGSGTLVVEALLIAADIAPGLLQTERGSPGWLGHDHARWEALWNDARARARTGLAGAAAGGTGSIFGYDRDPEMVDLTRRALATVAARLDVELDSLAQVHLEVGEVARLVPAHVEPPGLLVTNPPYGRRLQEADLAELYRTLGTRLRDAFGGWAAGVLVAEPRRERDLGLTVRQRHRLRNGAIDCSLLQIEIPGESDDAAGGSSATATDPGALRNRLRKNLKRLRSWRRREQVTCYRLYDADIPEYAAAIDIYGDHAHVQEYEAPLKVPTPVMEARRRELLDVVSEALGIPPDHVHHKVRRRQRGGAQYERTATESTGMLVSEGGHRFWVNLDDRLDTGLFLDDRNLRRTLAELAPGTRFLNLFAYTGAATVYAAQAGAKTTTSVDMSRTYLDWAARNLAANDIGGDGHELVRADCLQWLRTPDPARAYDLVFLAPPTYSRSKGMEGDFDVQRDHVELVRNTLRWLAPGGTLVFSTNLRTFQLDADALADLQIDDITQASVPPDFRRGPPIHHAFVIRRA